MPIIAKRGADTFVFNMPSLEFEFGTAYNYNFFLGCCISDIYTLKKQIPELEFNSKYELAKKVCSLGEDLSVSFLACMANTIQDFKYADDSFYCGEFAFDNEVFEFYCNCIALAGNGLTFEELEKQKGLDKMSPEERAWEVRKREQEARIRKAKEKDGKGTSIDSIIASVMYEFGVVMSDIKKMNKYGLVFLYSQCMKIASYEVTKIAAGTGNLGKKTKHMYFTNIK